MTKKVAQKHSKVCGILFIVLGVFELVEMVLLGLIAAVDVSALFDSLGSFENVSKSTLKIATIIMTIYFGIMAILFIFLGVKGIKASKGTSKGTGYIILAWILLVIEAISAVSTFIRVIQVPNLNSISTFLLAIIWVWVLYDFINVSKVLKEK